MKNLFLSFAIVALLGAGCAAATNNNNGYGDNNDTSGDTTTDGDTTTTDNGNVDEMTDSIRVSTPQPGDTVASPLTVSGEAVGSWYFEAVFPVELQDNDGNVIATGQAHANGDWMTTDFVPFTATLTFTVPSGVTDGVLYLRNDNPSGLAANAKDVHFPVSF